MLPTARRQLDYTAVAPVHLHSVAPLDAADHMQSTGASWVVVVERAEQLEIEPNPHRNFERLSPKGLGGQLSRRVKRQVHLVYDEANPTSQGEFPQGLTETISDIHRAATPGPGGKQGGLLYSGFRPDETLPQPFRVLAGEFGRRDRREVGQCRAEAADWPGDEERLPRLGSTSQQSINASNRPQRCSRQRRH
jgi:hypothetical protein